MIKLSELILKNAPKRIEINNPFNVTIQEAEIVEDTGIKVWELKKQLDDTDYYFIKDSEYMLVGKEPPYTIEELEAISDYRDGIREIINGLE